MNTQASTSSRRGSALFVAPGGMDMSTSLTLQNIRNALIRQEDTIIFSFLERAQFARNAPVYSADAIALPCPSCPSSSVSLLEWTLRETEQTHGKIRRYTSPDEHAFFPGAAGNAAPDTLPCCGADPTQQRTHTTLHACA